MPAAWGLTAGRDTFDLDRLARLDIVFGLLSARRAAARPVNVGNLLNGIPEENSGFTSDLRTRPRAKLLYGFAYGANSSGHPAYFRRPPDTFFLRAWLHDAKVSCVIAPTPAAFGLL